MRNQPFFSIIKPSDRGLVKQYIDTAKAWSPVIQNEKRSGGHGYCKFSLLKVSGMHRSGPLRSEITRFPRDVCFYPGKRVVTRRDSGR